MAQGDALTKSGNESKFEMMRSRLETVLRPLDFRAKSTYRFYAHLYVFARTRMKQNEAFDVKFLIFILVKLTEVLNFADRMPF